MNLEVKLYRTMNKNYFSPNKYQYLLKTGRQEIRTAYKWFMDNYRNEYIYKNELINQLVIPNLKTTSCYRELTIGKSRADFMIFNDKIEIYEIKTDLDTFHRLDSQLDDYYKLSPFVSIVVGDKLIESATENIPNETGIYYLNNQGCIETIRKPQKKYDLLDTQIIFNVLRKYEFEKIVKRYYGYLPKYRASRYYQDCHELLKKLPIDNLYHEATNKLKKRYLGKIDDDLREAPYELKELAYFNKKH